MLVVGGAVIWGTVLTVEEYMKSVGIPMLEGTPIDESVLFLGDVRIASGTFQIRSGQMIVPFSSIGLLFAHALLITRPC